MTSCSTRFSALLDRLRPEIESTLDRLVPAADTQPARIHEAMRYSLFAGGKRVRPALVLLTADALGLDITGDDVRVEASRTGGAALEMIHTYSLIHDDLPSLDDDDLRRGRPTLHRQYDEATAILAGDGLLTLGLTVLAAEPSAASDGARRRAAAMVGTAIGTLGMIGGQVDDLEAEKRPPEQPAQMLEAIHRRKTGALLVACLRLAGIYAEVSDELDGALAELGETVGLLFQIGDDILDVEGTSESLGKTAGKDAEADKLTYPALYGLSGAKRRRDDEHQRAHSLLEALPRPGHFPALLDYLVGRDH
ncbi:MAG: polyprenyl synthetase family protein [Thermoanaerobaculia bacterium]|nr:polyprenyl synthetase family protein [Thermoanaerobaculia bacterium]